MRLLPEGMVNPLFANMPTTIFEEMSVLARAHDAINLGQGFPDEDGPNAIRVRAAYATLNHSNQYPSSRGTPELRQAIAKFYERQGLTLDWQTQVTVTSGATEALAASILALVQPGDEVILFAPLYDAYAPLVKLAGGAPRILRLEPPSWGFTQEELASAFNERTRAVIINTPNNPTGAVWFESELAWLAELCVKHDVVAICDEVWEATVIFSAVHHALIRFPGMADRCVKIGSAGKLFALTGWKVGWMIAGPDLSAALARAHQFLTFTTPPNLQYAVAWGLANSEGWLADMPKRLAQQRHRLRARLYEHGFTPLDNEGTYFLCVDLTGSGIDEGDRDFCLRAVKEAGIAAIPMSSFYETDPVTDIIRLCYAKNDETLDEGARRLAHARDLSRNR